MIPVTHLLITGAVLFAIGMTIVLVKRNAIVVLMGIELMLNAANINFVAFSRTDQQIGGQMIALFVIIVAAAEAAVALAIVMKAVKAFKTSDVDEIKELNE